MHVGRCGAAGRRSTAFGMQSEHMGGNMMTAAENGDAAPPDWLISLWQCDQSGPLLFVHFYFSNLSLRSPSSQPCLLFFPLSLQLQSWQIAFTLLHFRIIARSCHPEKVTIPTALRFNSSVSSVTDSINGENGPKDDAKKRKAADVPLDAFSLWSHCNTRGGLAVLRSAATF